MNEAREWRYRVSTKTIALTTLFFSACAAVLVRTALRNTRGLNLNGLVELSAHSATIFFWILAALSLLFVLSNALVVFHALRVTQRVRIADGVITLPESRWSKQELALPIAELKRLELSDTNGQRWIEFYHGGRRFSIVGLMLPAKSDLDQIMTLLMPPADD